MAIKLTNTQHYQAIADAIRAKTGSADTFTPAEMADAISEITTGGGGEQLARKDINFYDYDGTLLAAWTYAQAAGAVALPDAPTHAGLVFENWNFTLAEVQAATRKTDVMPLYMTSDGATRFYIELYGTRRKTVTIYWNQNASGVDGVTVDWGDSTTPETVASTGNVNLSHEYAVSGDYVISLTASALCDYSLGNGTAATSAVGGAVAGYLNALKKVELGRNVIGLTAHCFNGSGSLETITFNGGLTTLGINTFVNCYALKALGIPRITTYPATANDANRSLRVVSLPPTITTIGSTVFRGCTELERITIPDAVTVLNASLFQNCTGLTELELPSGTLTLGTSCFNGCTGLKEITIPAGVSSLPGSCFRGCVALEHVHILNASHTYASTNTFYGCTNLREVTIPNGITLLDVSTFNGCAALTSVVIPASVITINASCFANCTFVTDYYVLPTTPPTLANANAFTGIPTDCVIHVPNGTLAAYQSAANWATYANRMVEEAA